MVKNFSIYQNFKSSWEQRKVLDLLELLTDYDANGSFADMAKNINTTDGDGYAWYVRITDLENPKPLSELKYVDESSYEFLKKTELHGGELLMAKRGNIGKVYIFEPRTKYATVAPNMYLLKLNNKVIPHFLYDYFVSEEGNKKLTRLNASSTMGALYKDDVKNIDVIMPSIEEQAMIGNFFQSIDHIITLHQCKESAFSEWKDSSFLQKHKTTWEQRKAKNLFVSTADKGHPELPVLSATQDRGMIRRDENSINIYHDKKNEEGYKRVLPGQFVIHLRSFQGGFAHSAIEGITSPAYTVFGFSEPEKHNPNYWKYVFTSKEFIRRLETVTYGIRDGRSISYDEFLTMDFVYPMQDEQTKIANYLDTLDNLITLHQCKCNYLIRLKHWIFYLLNKTDWEQRKLGDIVGIYDGVHQTPNYQNSGVMFLSVENIATLKSSKFISEEDFKRNYKIFPQENDILMTRIGDVGTTNVVTDNSLKAYYVSLALLKYKSTDPYFLSNAIQSDYVQKGLANRTLKTAIPMKINKDEIGKVSVMLPLSATEQQQIGTYFRNLDNLITLHQRELDKLKI